MVTTDKPRRRTYTTGETLPTLRNGTYRPVPVAPNQEDSVVGGIRAFAVLIRNRDTNEDIAIKESDDGDDHIIGPGEQYQIWETDGIKDVQLKVPSSSSHSGDDVEVRTIEAHNDFKFTDRIDAFVRAISHFFGTNITQTNVDTINNINDTLTIDDITASSATFDTNITGSNITQDIDVNAQSVGDIRTFDRYGEHQTRFLRALDIDSTDGSGNKKFHVWDIEDPASFDGQITGFMFRAYAPDDGGSADFMDGMGARILLDKGDTGSYTVVTPQWAHSTLLAERGGGEETTVRRYNSRRDCAYTFTPLEPIYFEDGDAVRFEVVADGNTQAASSIETMNVELSTSIVKRERA